MSLNGPDIVCLLYAFFRRSMRCGFCLPDLPSFEEIFEDADDRLFNKINNNDEHVLHCLLPPPSVAPQHYELRQRAHVTILFFMLLFYVKFATHCVHGAVTLLRLTKGKLMPFCAGCIDMDM